MHQMEGKCRNFRIFLNRLWLVFNLQKMPSMVPGNENVVINGCFFYVNEIGVRRGASEC